MGPRRRSVAPRSVGAAPATILLGRGRFQKPGRNTKATHHVIEALAAPGLGPLEEEALATLWRAWTDEVFRTPSPS